MRFINVWEKEVTLTSNYLT